MALLLGGSVPHLLGSGQEFVNGILETAVVHAPLTGIVLIIEMTGNYELILPLFIACFSALLMADWAGSPPIYEALLENDLH